VKQTVSRITPGSFVEPFSFSRVEPRPMSNSRPPGRRVNRGCELAGCRSPWTPDCPVLSATRKGKQ
jgi:hypothetical protein